MIEKVAPKQKITATKMNKIISSVNRHDDILKKQTVSPFPLKTGKAQAEMYFHVVQTAEAFTFSNPDYQANENESLHLGACIYTGGTDNISNLILFDDVPIKEVYQVKNIYNKEFEHLSATFEACDNKFGPYCPIYTFHQDNAEENTAIMVGVGQIDDVERTKIAIIFSNNSPNETPYPLKEDFLINENNARITQWRTIFAVDSFVNNDGVYTDKPNQYHLGQLCINSAKPAMFLDTRISPRNNWEVYVGDNTVNTVAFNNTEINAIAERENAISGWIETYTNIETPLWGIITGNSVTTRSLLFGTRQEMLDRAPTPTGGDFIPQFGPFPIAYYSDDKITQLFHGTPLNNFLLPDTSLLTEGMYEYTGTDFPYFKSLEISPMRSLDRNISGNYMNLFNFHSKYQNNEACINSTDNWFDVGIYDSEESMELSGYSTAKTMLIRSEDTNAELQYNIPTLDIKVVKDAMSSYITDIVNFETSALISNYVDWTCEQLLPCEDIIVTKFVKPQMETLSADFWHQGGAAGTNYGSTIGDSVKQTVIDLDNKVLKTTASGGQWSVENGLKIANNDLVMPDDGVIFFPSNNGWPKIIIGGILFGPKTIVDGNGEAQLVLGQITT
jgi:hypothetical protein